MTDLSLFEKATENGLRNKLLLAFFAVFGYHGFKTEIEVRSMVGTNIKKFREEKGYRQDDLAEQIHVTRQAVSNWENGGSLR